MTPGRYAHTAECRDDYCVHPIRCELDGICPPSPGGEADQLLRQRREDAPDPMADIRDMYARLGDVKPVEPIKLTRGQWDWVKAQFEPGPAPGWNGGLGSPLFGAPIHIVPTVEESTPHLKGWAGWAVVGHSDTTFVPRSEETE